RCRRLERRCPEPDGEIDPTKGRHFRDRRRTHPVCRTGREASEPASRSCPVDHQSGPIGQRGRRAAQNPVALMNPVISSLQTLEKGSSLSAAESQDAVACLLEGMVSEAITAAFLTAVRMKGETADELEGAVRAVRERMIRWESPIPSDRLLDTCG